LRGRAVVGDFTGADVSAFFVRGARATLEQALASGARLAILKDGSPSCATTYLYDGLFRGQRDAGQGVAAALLSQAGIRTFNENQLEEAAAYLEELEAESRG
jgi:uncharacterized protein YbbK (DUF523 family)